MPFPETTKRVRVKYLTPTPAGVVSPDVHPDRTATLRIRAPKATEVAPYGGWMPVTESKPTTKHASGIAIVKLRQPTSKYYFHTNPVPPGLIYS